MPEIKSYKTVCFIIPPHKLESCFFFLSLHSWSYVYCMPTCLNPKLLSKQRQWYLSFELCRPLFIHVYWGTDIYIIRDLFFKTEIADELKQYTPLGIYARPQIAPFLSVYISIHHNLAKEGWTLNISLVTVKVKDHINGVCCYRWSEGL